MAISDKLNKLIETKASIKEAIKRKGVSVLDTDTFSSYAEKIGSIETGGSTSQDDFYNVRTSKGIFGNGLFAYTSSTIQKKSEFIEFIENFDTSKMQSFTNMFQNCSYLRELNLSNWITTKVTNVGTMFGACSDLTKLDLSGWNTINIITLSYMFNGCSNLQLLDLSGWDTSNATTFYGVFPCQKLVEIKGIINLQKATNITNLFGGTASTSSKVLETVYIKNLNITGLNLQYCVALSHESLMYLINNLVPTETAKSIILGETNLAKLTDEEKAIAIEAGWTLA